MYFEEVSTELFKHHENLKKISLENQPDPNRKDLEENIYTYNGTDFVFFMTNKMKHLYYLGQEVSGDVLEIGFNAGNSCLIFLMANPTCYVHVVDNCSHAYVKPCVAYLNNHFNNRVILYEGDSKEVMKSLPKNIGQTIDIYHIDGGHDKETVLSDLKHCHRLSKPNSYIIMDDTDVNCVNEIYQLHVFQSLIRDRPGRTLLDTSPWKHRIGQFIN